MVGVQIDSVVCAKATSDFWLPVFPGDFGFRQLLVVDRGTWGDHSAIGAVPTFWHMITEKMTVNKLDYNLMNYIVYSVI